MVNTDLKIEGEKIYLRFVRQSDATEKYLAWLNDPEVMQGLATSGYTLENLKAYISDKSSQDKIAFFAVCLKNSDQHVGNVKLDFYDSEANVIEIGIMIGDKTTWGKGIGYEACHLAMKYGFEELGLRKIWLAVYENNQSAIKLYEKLGFKHEGQLRKQIAINGEYFDKLLMGIFKSEFK